MKIKLDKYAFMPVREHITDAGLDIRAIDDGIVRAKQSLLFHTGVNVQLPKGTAGLFVSKSGLMVKDDITSTGLVDEGYSGEVLVKWQRMCDKHVCPECGKPKLSDICPIILERSTHFSCDDCVTEMSLESLAEVEEIVMRWAKDHPEPVYPTWKEYLLDIGVIPDDAVPPDYVQELIVMCVDKPIPADIAQKLGLKAKE